MVLVVKNLPANAGDLRDMGSIPGSEDPLKEGMATHSSILAWRIPWSFHKYTYVISSHSTLYIQFCQVFLNKAKK